MDILLSFLDKVVDYFIYIAYLGVRCVIRFIPKSRKKKHISVLAKIVYFISGKYKTIVDRNIAYFFGDRYDADDRRKIAKAMYFRFLYYMFEVIGSKREHLPEIEVKNEQILLDAIANNEKIILLTAHYGYWELIAQYICANYRPFMTIGEKLRNSPRLTKELAKYREQFGLEVIERRGAIRSIAGALKAGKIVGFLTDQAVADGVNVLLFGKELIWLDTASRLAKQFDAVIIPCFITTEDFEKYTLFFDSAIRTDNSIDKEADIQRMACLEALSLQEAIRLNPEEYFWLHKRLKYQIKDFYEC